MSFYDIDPTTLPKDALYFHNVLLVLVATDPQLWEYEDCDQIWHLNQITSPQPTAYCFYPDSELQEQEDEDGEVSDFEIILVNHAVVEVCGNEVSWYEGVDDDEEDFDIRESWRL